MSIELNYLHSVKHLFHYYKNLGDKALAQVEAQDLNSQFQGNSNSIAILIKHMSGNMISRWSDFLTTDGEKPWRNRDREFDNDLKTMREAKVVWEKGWNCLFKVLDELTEMDLLRKVLIRGEQHTVLEAIQRQLAHYSYHVGQIVYLAKMAKGDQWQTLSIPKGNSEHFNKVKFSQADGKTGSF